eukprot:SAG22_NODE_2732_length_2271_cov_1.730203_3_plen_99_part_00
MVLTAEQHAEFVEQGAVVFDTRLPPALLDEVEAVLDTHCPPPPDGDDFRPVVRAALPPLVEAVSHPVFEEVARQLLRAGRVNLYPGYKGQCVYPEHAR